MEEVAKIALLVIGLIYGVGLLGALVLGCFGEPRKEGGK